MQLAHVTVWTSGQVISGGNTSKGLRDVDWAVLISLSPPLHIVSNLSIILVNAAATLVLTETRCLGS